MYKLLAAMAVSGAALFAVPGVAAAAPGDADCRKDTTDLLIATVWGSDEGTRGDAISDGFYGNEPNIEGPAADGGPSEQEPGTKAGRVVPSQSPGPKVTQGGQVVDGSSWGDAQQAIKAYCAAL